jgi:hypothetical protein
MERQSSEKQERRERLDYDDLPQADQMLYRERSKFLIDYGYITDKSIDRLAREIYESNWRKSF